MNRMVKTPKHYAQGTSNKTHELIVKVNLNYSFFHVVFKMSTNPSILNVFGIRSQHGIYVFGLNILLPKMLLDRCYGYFPILLLKLIQK